VKERNQLGDTGIVGLKEMEFNAWRFFLHDFTSSQVVEPRTGMTLQQT
jgi:hypothetical protein